MRRIRCLFGLHDFYAIFVPLIVQAKEPTPYQFMTVKRICMMPDCKKKEEFIIQLSGKLQDWDVLLSAPNFISEEFAHD